MFAADMHTISSMVCEVMEDVQKNLELLATLYDVPTYIHNAANVRRHDWTIREIIKMILTRRARRLAGHEVNRFWPECIAVTPVY